MNMARGARYTALEALQRMEERQGYSQAVLDEIIEEGPISAVDRGLLTHLFYGVLQRRGTLDWIIQSLSRRGIQGMDPLLKNILRLGCYQILYLDKIPSYAAIHETVSLTHLCRKRKWTPFVNALLRRLDREGAKIPSGNDLQSLGAEYSHPPWIIEAFLKKYGFSETRSLLAANNQLPPFSIRVNTLLTERKDLLEDMRREGLSPQIVHGLPEAMTLQRLSFVRQLSSFSAGHFYIQGLGAMVAAHLLGGEEGEAILDLCAGPGGKATHIAQLTNQRVRIVAIDIHSHQIERIKENCQRLKIHAIECLCADALQYTPSTTFHRVLVDAPCSDLGLLARRPEIRWKRRRGDVRALQSLQKKLLQKGAELLKKKGLLLYCTCTLTREENQEVVKAFLAQGGFHLLDGREQLKERGLGFLPFHEGKMLEYLPHREGSEGFFLALMQKK